MLFILLYICFTFTGARNVSVKYISIESELDEIGAFVDFTLSYHNNAPGSRGLSGGNWQQTLYRC